MKKICLLTVGILLIFLSSCNLKEISIKAVCDYYSNLNSYQTTANMNMYKENELVSFNVKASYLAPNYYRVEFSNASNNNEQIIIKNDEGVFVLTPILNKQFKFESDWPLNSSHAYLLSSIIKDIVNDETATLANDDTEISIKCKVTHKVNQKLTYMKFNVSVEDYHPISCCFYDATDAKQVEVLFNDFKENPNIAKDYFNADKIMDEKTTLLGEGSVENVSGSLDVSYLKENDDDIKVEIYEDRMVATYNEYVSYVVVCQKIAVQELDTPLRIYDDLEMTELGVVCITNNSINYFYKDQFITIYSSDLSVNEFLDVANTIKFA